MKRLFSGFGAVGEVRMVLGIGETERAGMGGNVAHQPLTEAKPGGVNRLAAEPVGREQFKDFAGAAQINRTHLGHQVGGNRARHLVEAGLSRAARGHDFAQAPQQNARAGPFPFGHRIGITRRRVLPSALAPDRWPHRRAAPGPRAWLLPGRSVRRRFPPPAVLTSPVRRSDRP